MHIHIYYIILTYINKKTKILTKTKTYRTKTTYKITSKK